MLNAETARRIKAGAAARVKNASPVADQICVAKVVKPVGPSSKVAGNSFMALRNTRATPAQMPGRRSGKVPRHTVRRRFNQAAPLLLVATIWRRPERIVPAAW